MLLVMQSRWGRRAALFALSAVTTAQAQEASTRSAEEAAEEAAPQEEGPAKEAAQEAPPQQAGTARQEGKAQQAPAAQQDPAAQQEEARQQELTAAEGARPQDTQPREATPTGFESLSLLDLLDQPLPTGSFVSAELMESPMSVTVITREQIQASGARTMSELLEIYVPGFQYMVNKWNGVVWGMRGVAADRNSKFIYLVNGQKMNFEASHGAYSELTLGLLDDVEKVEVLRGPAGMIYGSGSIAGAVNVITRTPQDLSGDVKGGFGSTHNPQIEAMAHVPYGERRGFTLSFGARNAAGFGDRSSRIYGNHEDPSTGVPSADGNPADGSAWRTPGNFRVSGDFHHDNVRIYARYTRQQYPTGQYFIVDPWPDYGDPVPADAPDREVDGRIVSPGDPLSNTESFGFNRRLHVVDNLAVQGTWDQPIDEDTLSFQLAWAGTTDALVTEKRDGYGVPEQQPVAGQSGYSFGDQRFTAGMKYLLQRVENLDVALGTEYRVDSIGRDLRGQNWAGGLDNTFFVDNVVYGNFALYGEGMYQVTPWLSLEAGARVDKHSRTDWILNPRAAALFFPATGHSIKLIVQTASNNGQADFYEYTSSDIDQNGNVRTAPYLEVPTDPNSTIIRPSTAEERQELKPERAASLELNSMHFLFDSLTIAPSVSITRVDNLFTWSADLFRTVNSGFYTFFQAELALDYSPVDFFRFGANHSYARVLKMDEQAHTVSRPAVTVVDDGDGTYSVEEIAGQTEQVVVNSAADQVTADGRNFLNLASNITKAHVTYSPWRFMTLHSNARVFWGLPGRQQLYEDDIEQGYNYLGVEKGAPIVKWNASAHFHYKASTLSLFFYDILGGAHSRHAVRHQQSVDPVQRGLYTVDQRAVYASFAHQFR